MADVLFTHSYFLRFDPKEFKGMMPYPPLGTLFAAAAARGHGYSVALHDVMLATSEQTLIDSLRTHHPTVLVLYDDSFNYLTKMCLTRMRSAAFEMIRRAKESGRAVVVFSSDATDHQEEYLKRGADYVICGEAETTLCELLDSIFGRSTKTRDEIDGLSFLEGDALRTTGKRGIIRNLDLLPLPAWDLVDFDRYRTAWKAHHGYFSLNISTTRGCPFHCNWCAKPLYGQVYNSRSPEHVISEMKFLRDYARPDHLWITDDIFGLKPGWIPRFAELVDEEDCRIPFKCLSRVDLLLRDDTIRHLKNAGCQTAWVGAESGSQKILDAMEKGTTVEEIHEAARQLRRADIRVGFFLQFGYPGETWKEIEETITMVRACAPDEIGISVSYPLPGTSFYERIKAQLGEKRNWIDSQDMDLMYPGEYHPDFYRSLHTVVHKRFSIWRGMRATRELFVNPTRTGGRSLRSIASMIYHSVTLPQQLRELRRLERANHARIN